MLVTLLPISTLVRPEQPENAEYPMLVTLSGISTLVRRPEQPQNAEGDIDMMPAFILTLVFSGIIPL